MCETSTRRFAAWLCKILIRHGDTLVLETPHVIWVSLQLTQSHCFPAVAVGLFITTQEVIVRVCIQRYS